MRTRMVLEVTEPARVVVKVAAARSVEPLEAGVPVQVLVEDGEVTHVLDLPVGRAEVSWQGTVGDQPPHPGGLAHELVMLRPSRYCPSDVLVGFAEATWPAGATPAEITSWVRSRLQYVPGSSSGHDDATRTLLTGQGVCRDYAHLVVTLCRALDVPARYTCVYAPGLLPMELHAVAEVWHDGAWELHDATGLAPRASMVRVATGRDAADTAFLDVVSGHAELLVVDVVAVVDGDLPVEDLSQRVLLG